MQPCFQVFYNFMALSNQSVIVKQKKVSGSLTVVIFKKYELPFGKSTIFKVSVHFLHAFVLINR